MSCNDDNDCHIFQGGDTRMLGDLQKGNLDLRGSDVVLKPYKEEKSCDINFIIR